VPGPAPGPQAPGQSPPAPSGPEGLAPSYGGPVPPGGWGQQASRPAPGAGFAGRPLAGWGSRVGATLLDGLILVVPVALIVALVVAVVLAGSEVGGLVIGLIAMLAFVVASLFYAPVLMAREGPRNGQTWGKQIVGVRVTRDDGRPVELGFGFMRELVVKNLLFGVVGGFLFYIPTIVNLLWPLWDDQNRTLHDMLVKTHVVKG
jgi:uncharacterized RDD family membrane protein YckC